MNSILDNLVVGLLLFASIVYAFVKLAPQTTRSRLYAGLAGWTAHAPKMLRLGGVSQRLSRAAAIKTQGACGGCDSCGSEPQAQKVAAEIRVPINRIARARPTTQGVRR